MGLLGNGVDLKDILDQEQIVAETEPASAPANALWRDSCSGQLFVRYQNAWVEFDPGDRLALLEARAVRRAPAAKTEIAAAYAALERQGRIKRNVTPRAELEAAVDAATGRDPEAHTPEEREHRRRSHRKARNEKLRWEIPRAGRN